MRRGPAPARTGAAGGVGLRLAPAVLASWLAGAHFLRFGALELVLVLLLLPLVLVRPQAWAVRLIQAVLAMSFLMWLQTAWAVAAERVAAGEPGGRPGLILAGVALFTLAAALFLETRPVRARYRLRTADFFAAAPGE